MTSEGKRRSRQQGSIDLLPSGALRVRVYAGVDPVTKKRYDLVEVVPAGPKAAKEAEAARVRMLNEMNERRNPRTNATVSQLLERHLRENKLEPSTEGTYRGYLKKHVLPFVGKEKVGKIDAEILDSLYYEMRRCREHCSGRKALVDHRTLREHDCDERCRRHECRPLGESTIRQVHMILSGAFRRAQRWKWISVNPASTAEPPAPARSNPDPPSPEEAARIVTAAWDSDADWGMLVWLTMVTGYRRGELCAIRWEDIDLPNRVLHLSRSIGQLGRRRWEKDTKSHADRRVVLDEATVELLGEHRDRWVARMAALGMELSQDAYVFSLKPDGSEPRIPDSVTQRYGKLARRLGIRTTLHKLRHYNATELIAAGVNIRTVAGRLGHGSGGTTTLRSYTAWVSEADQRAAGEIATRMPERPARAALPERQEFEASNPYEKIAVDLRDRIYAGELAIGMPIPSVKQLARDHDVSVSTAQRAVRLLEEWGLVRVATGRPTLVQPRADTEPQEPVTEQTNVETEPPGATGDGVQPVDLEVRKLGATVATLRTSADPADATVLHRLLVGAVKRDSAELAAIDEYELVVRRAGHATVVTTYVAATA
ncbi:DNA-binding transcriptional regulator YhcF (GntR family) [Haloactinopolyspora alba]|uniref:DNA-binding transcriptional regulator YhcF (GntR family) n=1 Tax=Haloactinopolyspora alba TaxID=648780 RepID=A0A2P8EFF9_9ACTN|nr:tyrosine-type recombinase/integrase [Haloactinopolyspora alba]PSL08193.1 DNA-binding transcriptional regulator YhcF (GntR family) [Haloactinopolyspora alba]